MSKQNDRFTWIEFLQDWGPQEPVNSNIWHHSGDKAEIVDWLALSLMQKGIAKAYTFQQIARCRACGTTEEPVEAAAKKNFRCVRCGWRMEVVTSGDLSTLSIECCPKCSSSLKGLQGQQCDHVWHVTHVKETAKLETPDPVTAN